MEIAQPPRSRRGRSKQVLSPAWYRRVQASRILRRCDGKLPDLSDSQIAILLRTVIAYPSNSYSRD